MLCVDFLVECAVQSPFFLPNRDIKNMNSTIPSTSLRERCSDVVGRKLFSNFIIGVILLNAAVLGLQTLKDLSPWTIQILDIMDQTCLGIFIIEIMMKSMAFRWRFFTDGWNAFDFLVVAIALGPTDGMSVLRAFRIFRVMRLINAIHSMRRVVSGMILAIPGVASVGGLLLIVFYIGAVMTTNFYAQDFPAWFGDLGKSMYTLFQVMTLESWSMGIVRPVMEAHPYSWAFFIPFILVTTFTVLNLFIGVIVDAMASVKEEENGGEYQNKREQTVGNIEEIKADILEIREALRRMEKSRNDA